MRQGPHESVEINTCISGVTVVVRWRAPGFIATRGAASLKSSKMSLDDATTIVDGGYSPAPSGETAKITPGPIQV